MSENSPKQDNLKQTIISWQSYKQISRCREDEKNPKSVNNLCWTSQSRLSKFIATTAGTQGLEQVTYDLLFGQTFYGRYLTIQKMTNKPSSAAQILEITFFPEPGKTQTLHF